MSRIVTLETRDIRFPTSRTLDGSDATNVDPDYSAAYVRIVTDAPGGPEGHSLVFTIGRGNDVEVAAIQALSPYLIGKQVEPLLADMGATWRAFVDDSQLRWLGPEKGVMHMAIGAVINALWDLKAKLADLPLWQLLARLSPQELVDLVDFRGISDALTPAEALAMLERQTETRVEREQALLASGYPAYTTTPGWLGYDDAKLDRLARDAVSSGFTQIKLKVGANRQDDIRRLAVARSAVGGSIRIAIDANQRWERAQAIDWIRDLTEFDLAWIEEPTHPDDILAYSAISKAVHPIPLAGGEHIPNAVMFKQFLLSGALQIIQIDATRVGGVNENIAIMLLAAKFGVPVCPHAGGVGLCEMVQHLAMFDYVAISGSLENRWIEFVDHLHEHFVVPVDVRGGRYWPPASAGSGAEMLESSRVEYTRGRGG